MSAVRFGRKTYRLPGSRTVRLSAGTALVIGGAFGFLPVLGFWMIPLGLLILSIDVPAVRRGRRRLEIWWGYKRQKNGRQKNGDRRG